MTIQRQYSLPNCKLVLQGLNNDADQSGRPLLSMVTNVECHLAGQKEPLTGGREFLESLAKTVSDYAQGYLSGIQHLIRRDRRQQAGLVQIQQVGSSLHRLTVQAEAAGTPSEVNLTTVQLFDLVEAVDQLFADAQTLPDLSLKLDSLSKRNVVSQEPIAKRAAPLAIGLSSLAGAAAVLFMLPAPQVQRPEAADSTTPTSEQSPTASPGAATPTANPSATPSATDSASGAASDKGGAGLNLADISAITEPDELDRLTVQLYDKLDFEWKKKPTFDGSLIYRVGVNSEGEIVGYKYGNDAALTYVNDTPLADVQFDSPNSSSSATPDSPAASPANSASPSEPLAQFRVVFKSDGVLEVSPWDGQPTEGTANETPPSPSPQ